MTGRWQTELAVATRAAEAARAIHRRGRDQELRIESKSTATDLVTQIDREAETAIREVLLGSFPEDTILGEEQGEAGGSSGRRWIVDPLDGTLNYAHGLPWYCVSIALEDGEGVQVGVVLESVHGELFTAIRGGGAFVDGRPVRVTDRERLAESMLATGFAYRIDWMMENVEIFARVIPQARAIRRPGSAALDLANLAAGRLDGFWELYLNPWDVAAGTLLVQEAGGRVTDERGAPRELDGKVIVASNGRIHDELIAALAEAAAAGR
jgi:myo-inositol-1(or 4)-monophosphatase